MQDWTGPGVSRSLKVPTCKSIGTRRLSALKHRPPLPLRKFSWYSFLFQVESIPASGRIMSMKNSNDISGNRTRDLPACSAVPQTTHPNLYPFEAISIGDTLLNEHCLFTLIILRKHIKMSTFKLTECNFYSCGTCACVRPDHERLLGRNMQSG